MIKRSLFVATLLAATTGLALAQQTPPPPPNGGPDAGPAEAGAPPPPPGPRGPHGPRRWFGHHGDMGKGFMLSLGDGVMLRVQCGDEPLQGCVDAAGPLIEMIGNGEDMGSGDDMDMPDTDDMKMPPAPPADLKEGAPMAPKPAD